MLDSEELATMRSDSQEFLPETCSILRRTIADDGIGGQTVTTVTFENIPCMMSPATAITSNEREDAGRVTSSLVWKLTVAYNQSIELSDRVLWKGRTFEVIDNTEDRSWVLSNRVTLVEES